MSDLYDDTNGNDLPNITELIKSVEEQFKGVRQSEPFDEFAHTPLEDVARIVTDQFKGDSQSEALVTYPGLATSTSVNPQDSRPNGSAPETPTVEVPPAPSTLADTPPETKTVIEIRNHPFIGTYVSEQLVAVGSEGWWAEVFGLSVKFGMEKLTPEQIIETIDRNDEAIRRTKTQNQGLRVALEHHLSKMNESHRAAILDKQAEFKKRRKSADESVKAKTPKKATTKISGSQEEKTVRTFKNLGMSREETIDELKG